MQSCKLVLSQGTRNFLGSSRHLAGFVSSARMEGGSYQSKVEQTPGKGFPEADTQKQPDHVSWLKITTCASLAARQGLSNVAALLAPWRSVL
jgi:hypothetical protein